jgi:hypothetical protein
VIELRGLAGVSAWLVYNKIVFSLLFIRRFNYAANDQSVSIAQLRECETLDEFKAVASQLTTERFDAIDMSMSQCVERFKAATEDDRRALLFEAISVTSLTDDESLRLLAMHKDKNGISFSKANISNVPVADVIPMMIDTLIACSDTNADFALMNADDLAIMKDYRVDITNDANEILMASPNLKTGNVIVMSLKRIAQRLKGATNVS